jgi:hypothetical protein
MQDWASNDPACKVQQQIPEKDPGDAGERSRGKTDRSGRNQCPSRNTREVFTDKRGNRDQQQLCH